jgi:hydrogenase expression/formation protein HypD
LDALNIARQNPNKKIVFLAVGFETTAPTIALTIVSAKKEKLKNLFFFSALKLIPPAMGYLLKDKRAKVSGFLCPGHVSSIIGTRPYEFIPKRHGIGCCVAGFEPLDILEGIYILLRQINEHRPRVENQYMRVVNRRGNLSAQKIIFQVFEKTETSWRGLGRIPKSGLRIKEEFSQFDSEKVLLDARRLAHGRRRTTHDARHTTQDTRYKTQCKCADVLKGIISPLDCPLFSKVCSPNNPKGPCMVSSEGACNAYYKYR